MVENKQNIQLPKSNQSNLIKKISHFDRNITISDLCILVLLFFILLPNLARYYMDILQQQQQTKLIVLVDAKARRRLSITKNHSKNFIENSITENQLTSSSFY